MDQQSFNPFIPFKQSLMYIKQVDNSILFGTQPAEARQSLAFIRDRIVANRKCRDALDKQIADDIKLFDEEFTRVNADNENLKESLK